MVAADTVMLPIPLVCHGVLVSSLIVISRRSIRMVFPLLTDFRGKVACQSYDLRMGNRRPYSGGMRQLQLVTRRGRQCFERREDGGSCYEEDHPAAAICPMIVSAAATEDALSQIVERGKKMYGVVAMASFLPRRRHACAGLVPNRHTSSIQ